MRKSFFVITLSMLMFVVNNGVYTLSAQAADTSFSTDLEATINGQNEYIYDNMSFSDGTLSYGAAVNSGGGDAKSGVSASVKETFIDKNNAFKTETAVNGAGVACANTQYGATINGTVASEYMTTVTNSHVEVSSSSSSVSR
ncbi:MAG: hypothetical protein FDX30_01140 [Chlorobium sp.]|nr:MAG: hypothetical protein FDX30_01140 [Chlorobium sp.]